MKVGNHHQLPVKWDDPKTFSSSSVSAHSPRDQIFTVKCEMREERLYFPRLVESIRRRVAALCLEKGSHTRYYEAFHDFWHFSAIWEKLPSRQHPPLDGGAGAPGATSMSDRNIPSERTKLPNQEQTLADTCWSRGHKHHSNHQPRSESTHTPP
ncbi:hypothetical protein AVEN_160386-1 [Araneus ventricosus]|uniref:Uncharacterized protein n=1 Tax=Araneus ventricosus TaxID=182803 RepID=A0A4Y2L8G7_ARAVE|nr:hypothetical protein AVEN_160386-1 [Araneus ventricosus]